MANRRRPELVATRVTEDEKVMVETEARFEGVTISDLVHGIVMPEVRQRLARRLREDDSAAVEVSE